MEIFNIRADEGVFYIDGIEDAVYLKKLPKKIGKKLSDYSLHGSDLDFAKRNLEMLNNEVIIGDYYLSQALWRNAIVHYMKCFTSAKARGQLSFEKVYKDAPPETKIAFDYIKAIRNKTIAHDENSYSQSIPCAAINNGEKVYKVEKILFMQVHADSLNDDNYGNFYLLVTQALEFVSNEIEKLFVDITDVVEMLSFDEIMGFDNVKYNSPALNDVCNTRQY